MITRDEALAVVSYDPETGVFRRVASSGRRAAGDVAGYIKSDGYRLIWVGKFHYAHRLAWLISTGQWPANEIDHINGQRDDNRIVNLRECSRSQNMRNVDRRGYHWSKRTNRWRVVMKIDGKKRHIGSFTSEEAARAAYEQAAAKHHGDFAFVEPPKPAKQMNLLEGGQ